MTMNSRIYKESTGEAYKDYWSIYDKHYNPFIQCYFCKNSFFFKEGFFLVRPFTTTFNPKYVYFCNETCRNLYLLSDNIL